MKKIWLGLILILFLCGCEKTAPEYLISSIGFDSKGETYKVCFEAVIINTENTEQSVKLLKGEGETIKEAVDKIERQCTQPLLLSHCGVLAVGEDITRQQFLEICDYCYEKNEITLSAFFIKTKNAQKLLSAKPISSACVGYDIMGLIKQNKHYKNRFFEVINSDYKASIPKISLKDGGLLFENA